jgi:hypothetical protein
MPLNWTCPDTGKTFFTGANPSPAHVLCGASPFIPLYAAPPQAAFVPKYRSNYMNDRYGDCVTAEEAFTKSCHNPEIIIPDEEVVRWCRQHGVLNGADLADVVDSMIEKGFQVSSQLYNDGTRSSVDYSNQAILQAAIAQSPVKIAIAAGALPGGAGSDDGWYKLGGRNGRTDHCVAICGYGPAGWLYQQLGQQLPSALQSNLPGYLVYTWSTIGFVDHAWIMGTCVEAWLRTPATVGVPPLPPEPTPNPGPGPGPGPFPTIVGEVFVTGGRVSLPANLPDGKYALFPEANV